MFRRARGLAWAASWVLALVGCRDWAQFEGGEGGAGATTGSTSSSGGGSSTTTTTTTASTTGSGGAGGGEGGASAGGGGAGGGVTTECGTIALLSDDFEGAELDWRWRDVPAFVSLADGDLLYAYPTDGSWFELFASAHYDMEGRGIVFEIDTPPGPGTGLWIDLGVDYDNYVEYYLAPNGELRYGQEVDGNFGIFASEPFDLADHRFLRFREDAGTVYFDTSGDGVTWVEQQDVPGMFDPAHTTLWLGGHSDDPLDPGAEARIARIYGDPLTGDALCPATSIGDDFDDAELSSEWNQWQQGNCSTALENGRIVFDCPQGTYTDNGIYTWGVHDFTGAAVSVEIVEYGDGTDHAYGYVGLGRPETDSHWAIGVDHGELRAREAVDGSYNLLEATPFDPVAHRFVRIRESGGQIYFETSQDGLTYVEFEQHTPSFSITQVGVFLFGGGDDNFDVRLVFDNLDVSIP